MKALAEYAAARTKVPERSDASTEMAEEMD